MSAPAISKRQQWRAAEEVLLQQVAAVAEADSPERLQELRESARIWIDSLLRVGLRRAVGNHYRALLRMAMVTARRRLVAVEG